jgi:hypothetical protein
MTTNFRPEYAYNSLTCVLIKSEKVKFCNREGIKISWYLQGGCCSRKFKRFNTVYEVGEFKIQIFKLRELTRIEKRVCLHAWEFSQIFIQRSNENKSWWKLRSDGWILLIKRAKTLINYNIIKLWASSIKSIIYGWWDSVTANLSVIVAWRSNASKIWFVLGQ